MSVRPKGLSPRGIVSRAARAQRGLRGRMGRWSSLLAVGALATAPLLVTHAVTAPEAAAAAACVQSNGSIPNVTQFDMNLADRVLVSGTPDTVGAVYKYVMADPDNLFDIIVTVVAMNDPDGAAGLAIVNPGVDRETYVNPNGTFTTSPWLDTPIWDLNNRYVNGNLDAWMTMKYQFVDHATGLPVSLNVMATTADNDSGNNLGNYAREYVRYETAPTALVYGTGTVLAQPDANGKIWGKTTVLSGVQVENTASVAGVYTNVSEFTWTSGHLITDTGTPPSYDDTWQRMGALSLRCETALLGVLPPDLTLEKTLITAGPYTVGQSIQYTLIPKNIGFGPAATGWFVREVPQTGLTITAMTGTGYTCNVSTKTCTASGALAPGATGGTITVTATISSSTNGELRNVAYVAPSGSATTPETIPLGTAPTYSTDTVASTTNNDAQAVITFTPKVELVKWISNVVDTTGNGIIGPGDTLTYSFKVTNTGNVVLAPVVINDTKLGITNTQCVPTLAVGATTTCTFTKTYVITEGDLLAGGVVNTATATGTPPSGLGLTPATDVSDTGTAPTTPGVVTTVTNPETVDTPIPSTVYTSVTNSSALGDDPTVLTLQTPVASIVLLKSITNVVDTNGNGFIGQGDTVTYTFKVTNTGNVTLAPVTITDTKLNLTDWACLATLAPGTTALCTSTASYIIQAEDVLNKGIVNTATATGTPPTTPSGAPVIPPATDVSDTGTYPTTPGHVSTVVDPATNETTIPTSITTTVTNSPTDPTSDPTVLSLAPYSLPRTGGVGVNLYTSGGALIVVGGLAWFLLGLRRRRTA